MSSSFFALLDDIAVLAKAAAASLDDVAAGAAKAAAKSAGVVIDDAAVTPQYVRGITPKRELPVIWRITRGSLVNKAIIIVAIMLLSLWAPWVFPWLLLVGGTYLAFEGAEKVWHVLRQRFDREHHTTVDEVLERSEADEKQIVASAVRTDLVLSTEIMLIALSNVETGSWGMRLAILIAVALLMTVLVYGAVALLVKMDDVGLWLSTRGPQVNRAIGLGLVRAMPWVFRTLSVVGVVAMLWVGGHILLVNLAELGVHLPLDLVHAVTGAFGDLAVVLWLAESLLAALFGLVWGAAVAVAVGVLRAVWGRIRPTHSNRTQSRT